MENEEEARRRFERERSQRRRDEEPDRQRAYSRRWAQNNPEKRAAVARRNWLKVTYSITPEIYDSVFERQGNGCAICGRVKDFAKHLVVDHDHSCCPGSKSCGQCIRGILCRMCNVSLGHFGDNMEGVLRAVKYLENPPKDLLP